MKKYISFQGAFEQVDRLIAEGKPIMEKPIEQTTLDEAIRLNEITSELEDLIKLLTLSRIVLEQHEDEG